MNKEEFIKNIKNLNIKIENDQLNKLEKFYELVINENNFQNLTRIIKKEEFYLKHLYDSLTIVKIINLNEEKTLCDVGTGAGFPGIVLKIIFPNLKIDLIESTEKKARYLKNAIEKLQLKDINVYCKRVENHTKKYDIVISRAMSKLNILVELCIPITKINGYLIAMKGNCEEEIINAKNALKELNSKIIKIEKFKLFNGDNQRTLIKIQKQKEVNGKYPRKFEQIIKNPL